MFEDGSKGHLTYYSREGLFLEKVVCIGGCGQAAKDFTKTKHSLVVYSACKACCQQYDPSEHSTGSGVVVVCVECIETFESQDGGGGRSKQKCKLKTW